MVILADLPNRKTTVIGKLQRVSSMQEIIVTLILGLVLNSAADSAFAYSRGVCGGYGSPRVYLHVNAGPRHNRGGDGDKLILFFMLSSTSTSIYCISMADEEEDWNSSRRNRNNRYSYINYDRLQEESARGQGEYLAALSYALGCPAEVTTEFAASVQKNYLTLFKKSPEFQGETFMSHLDQLISDNPKLQSLCT
ncbi:MAG: DUF3015 family protein, partial [SAR324 cluster bacterium]|nr:DUF3015 family protein [SAR324 cluster bacterium]